MVCAPVRSIMLGDYLSVQAHKPCSMSHIKAPHDQSSDTLFVYLELMTTLKIRFIVYSLN